MGNIHNLFATTKGTDDLRGLHLVVIDDVSTTGATLHAATAVLLQAGAASVNVVAFARTPKPDG
jgi:predicted amidophosphoribosyltransferase